MSNLSRINPLILEAQLLYNQSSFNDILPYSLAHNKTFSLSIKVLIKITTLLCFCGQIGLIFLLSLKINFGNSLETFLAVTFQIKISNGEIFNVLYMTLFNQALKTKESYPNALIDSICKKKFRRYNNCCWA